MKVATFMLVVAALICTSVTRPVGAELLFHYNFEGEVLEDASGNQNLGEIRGDARRVNSRTGMGLKFDGEDDYIFTAGESAGPLMFMHDPFAEKSVAMWIKADDVNVDQTIFDEGGTSNGYCIKIKEGMLQLNTTNGGTGASVTAEYTNTDWHHIAGIYKEGELHLYIDGKEAAGGEAPYKQVGSHGNDGAIGATFDGDASGGGSNGMGAWNLFQGVMDEIYFYNSTITAEEISELYQQGLAVEPGRLTTRWGELKSSYLY